MLREGDVDGDGVISRADFHELLTPSPAPDRLSQYPARSRHLATMCVDEELGATRGGHGSSDTSRDSGEEDFGGRGYGSGTAGTGPQGGSSGDDLDARTGGKLPEESSDAFRSRLTTTGAGTAFDAARPDVAQGGDESGGSGGSAGSGGSEGAGGPSGSTGGSRLSTPAGTVPDEGLRSGPAPASSQGGLPPPRASGSRFDPLYPQLEPHPDRRAPRDAPARPAAETITTAASYDPTIPSFEAMMHGATAAAAKVLAEQREQAQGGKTTQTAPAANEASGEAPGAGAWAGGASHPDAAPGASASRPDAAPGASAAAPASASAPPPAPSDDSDDPLRSGPHSVCAPSAPFPASSASPAYRAATLGAVGGGDAKGGAEPPPPPLPPPRPEHKVAPTMTVDYAPGGTIDPFCNPFASQG